MLRIKAIFSAHGRFGNGAGPHSWSYQGPHAKSSQSPSATASELVLFFMISQSRSPTLFPQKWDKIFQEASIFLNPLLTLIFFQQFV